MADGITAKYGLITGKVSSQNALKKVDYQSSDIKHQISNVVKMVMNQYRFSNFPELRAVLKQFNILPELVSKQPENRVCGMVYCCLNDNGEKVGVPIKSSRINKSVGFPAMQRKIYNNKKWHKENKPSDELKYALLGAMNDQETKKGFVDQLKSNNIDAVLWTNEDGRIYGATYIDHNSKMVYKGSALGEDFSANSLNELYGTGELWMERQEAVQSPETGQQPNPASGSFLDIFDMSPNPTDYDPYMEPVWKRKKKKKKKGFSL